MRFSARRRGFLHGIKPNDLILFLVLANALMFAAWYWVPDLIFAHLALWPLWDASPSFKPWQLVSYGFLHSPGYIAHILFNMFALWMFGRPLAELFGTDRFLIYYIVCMIGAGITQLAFGVVSGDMAPTIGASGSVFGLLLAFGMCFPNRTIMLLIPPIPIKAKYFVVIYGAIELYLGFSVSNSSVAHFAHLGGMATGFVLLRFWRAGRRGR